MEDPLSPDIGDCLSEGWTLYRKDPVLLSAATVLMAIILGVISLIPFAGTLVYAPLLAGLYSMIILVDRGQGITISNLFDGFKDFLPLVLASVVVSFFVAIGLFLLVLPGLYLIVAYGFTTLLIIDH